MSLNSSSSDNPFPGLRPFRSDEHHLFFGREEQTAALLQLLRKNRFLAIVGTSGSGKSSLVRAGMIAELHGGTMTHAGSTWEVMILRPGGSPIENLARAMVEGDLYDAEDSSTLPRLRATLTRSRFGLVEAMRQSDVFEPGVNLLVVVDQFEELFRFRQQGGDSEEAATAFVNLLLTASEQAECPIYIAITMRSDYLGDCSEIPGLAEAVNEGEYLIPRLLRDQKRDAIEKPIGVGGAKISPLLVQRLLNDVGDDPDQLPVLQHALMRTWEVWAANPNHDRPIDLTDFEATGGLADALSNHADELYASLPDDRHRAVCERVFKSLTEKGSDNRGIRRPARLAMLQAIADADRRTLATVLDAFRQAGVTFLMPGMDTELTERTIIDLSHESLMRGWQRLRMWVEEESQSARIFRRLLDTARLWSEGKAGLFRDPDLHIALSWRDEEQPNAEWADQYGGQFQTAINFLEASNAEVEAEQNAREATRQHELEQAQRLAEAERQRASDQARAAVRFRRFARGLAVVAVVALLATVFAWRARQEADKQRTVAVTAQENTEKALKEVEAAKKLADQNLVKAKAAEDAALAAELRSREFRYATDMQLAATLINDKSANAGQLLAALTDHDLEKNKTLDGKEDLRGFEWYYLKRLIEERAAVLDGFGQEVVDATLNANGELVTLTTDSRLQHWNPETRQQTRPSLDLKKGARAATQAVSRDGTLVALCVGNKVSLINAATGKDIGQTIPTQARMGLVFSRDGKMLVTVDAEIGWWDATTGRPIARQEFGLAIYGYTAGKGSVSLSADGLTLAVGGQGGSGGQFSVFRMDPESHDITQVVDKAGHQGTKRTLAISPDGKTVVISLYFAGGLYVFDVSSGKQTDYQAFAHRSSISAMEFDASGSKLVTASMDGTVKVWQDVKKLESSESSTLVGHSEQVDLAVFAANGTRLITAGKAKNLRLWNLQRDTTSLHRTIADAQGSRVGFSPDGILMAVSGENPLQIRDGVTGQVIAQLPKRDDTLVTDSVAFSPDNRLLAAGFGGANEQSFIELWDIDRRERLAVLPGTTDIPNYKTDQNNGLPAGLVFSPDGRQLVASFGSVKWLGGGDFGSFPLLVYDVAAQRVIRRLEGPRNYNVSVAFSSDGSRLANASYDGTARIWDTNTWRELHVLQNPDTASSRGYRRVHDVAFSPDGKRLAMASAESNVIIWDVESGAHLQTLRGHSNEIWSVAFSPSGRTLASGSMDGTVRLWNVATWRELVRLAPDEKLEAKDLAFSANGRRLLASNYVGKPMVWSVEPDTAGPPLATLTTWLKSGFDFPHRIRLLSENLQLHKSLDQLAQQEPDHPVVQAALAATKANWHASREEWTLAVEQFDRLKAQGPIPTRQQNDDARHVGGDRIDNLNDWLRTPGLLRLATALLNLDRSADAATLLDGGEKRRLADGNATRATSLGFDSKTNAFPLTLTHVSRGSPAWQAGLRTGDIILKFNDVELTAGSSAEFLKQAAAGSVILTVQHPGQEQPVVVEVAQTKHIHDDLTVELIERLLALVDQKLNESANNPGLRELRAELAGQSSNYEKQVADDTVAIEALLERPAAETAADLARLYRRRGNAYVELKQWQQALDDYSKGITDETTDEELLANQALAQSQVVMGDILDRGAILATSEWNGHEWHYTKTKPTDDWSQRDFNDGAWSRGEAPFGTTDFKPTRTVWTTGDIWLRREFEWTGDAGGDMVHLRLLCDDLADVFVNGKQVYHRHGHTFQKYVDIELASEQRADLTPGRLCIAVHCQNLEAIGYIDVGLYSGPLDPSRNELAKKFSLASRSNPWQRLAIAHVLRDDQPAIDQLVKRRPQSAGTIGDLFVNGDNKDWQRAAEIYSQGITPETTDAELLGKRAKANEQLRDWKSAATDWSRATGENPKGAKLLADFAGRLLNAEQIELAVQQRQRARDILEATLKTDSGDAPAIDVLAALLLDMSEPVPKWATLKPAELKMTGGATLALQDDQSLLVERKPHVITLSDPGNSLQAIRIETSPLAAAADQDAPAFKEYRILSTGLPAEGFRGRYVRIDLPYGNARYPRLDQDGESKALCLAEVQVFRGDENIARSGKAQQSSTAYEGNAGRAIDGNTNGYYYSANSSTHSSNETGMDSPWWELDLGGEQTFDRLVLWNRTEEPWSKRLRNFRVRVLDAERQLLFEQFIEDAPSPSREITRQVQLAKIEPGGADEVARWRISLDGNLARRFRISRVLMWSVLNPSTLTASEGTQITAQNDSSFVAKASDSGEVKLSELPARTKTVRFETASVSKQAPSAAAAYKDYRIEAVDASRSETGALRGRYVRIDLPGSNAEFPREETDKNAKMLNFAEMQVFRGDRNIALRKSARQSSDYNDSAKADVAVDGVTDDSTGNAHTNPEIDANTGTDPWWEVDLAGQEFIDRIVVWNRPSWIKRMNHFRVRVLDEDRNVVLEQVIDEAPKPSREIDCHSWLVTKKPGQAAQAPQWSFSPLKEQRYRISTADTLLRTKASAADQPDILLADFEGQDYGEWRVTGVAFGPGPARGTLPKQTRVDGFLGKGLVNSYFNGDGTTGTLTSPQFKIERRFIRFLIGGGKSPGKACINLLVDRKVVRTATGPNDRPGGSERLDWRSWDVGEVTGKTATIEIVDQVSDGWGHINIDHIVQTDQPLPSLSFDSNELAWIALDLGNVTPAPGTSLTPEADGSFVVQAREELIALPALADTAKAVRVETASTAGSSESAAPAFKDYRVEAINAPRSESGSLQGRYVRIDLPGDNERYPRRTADRAEKWVTIAECQVFQADRNIALNKSVRQSSTHKDPAAGDWAAGRAVDGDTDGTKYATMSSTTGERDPWWEIDLASQQPMDRIVIWNRTEGDTTQRMNHFRIRVLDADRNVVFEQVIDEAPNPSREFDCRSLFVASTPPANSGGSQRSLRLSKDFGIDPGSRFRLSSIDQLYSLEHEEAVAETRKISQPVARLAAAYDFNGAKSSSADWFRKALDRATTDKGREPILTSLQSHAEPLTQLLKQSPDDIDLQLALARSHVKQGQKELARKNLQVALTEFESARDIFTRLRAQNPEPEWTVLTPTEMTSEEGATLTLQQDGSILAGGEKPEKDAYTLRAACNLQRITAVRLQALPHASLPSNGPGRVDWGNFHLTGLRVSTGERQLVLNDIAVTFGEGDTWRNLIDGKLDHQRGWSIFPQKSEQQTAIVAVQPFAVAGTGLEFQLLFSGGKSETLGRFRLSVAGESEAFEFGRFAIQLAGTELMALDVSMGRALAGQNRNDEAASAFARAMDRIDEEKDRQKLIEQFQEHQAALIVLAGLRPKDSALQLALAKSLATSGRKALDEKRDAEALPQLSQAQKLFAKLASEHAQTEWTVLRPLEMKTEIGTAMELQEDGSVFVERPDGNDTYTLVFQSELKGIKGLRLEALSDSRLPGGGPGWFNDGNFVLSELSLEVASASDSGQTRSIALQNAFADFSQEHWHVQGAIDGNGTTGWAVGTEFNKDHVAVFETAEDLGDGEVTRLTIRLNHRFEYQDNRHLLGRFRLSVTSDTNAAKVAQFQHDLKTSGLRELQLALGNAYGRPGKLDEAATAFSAAFDLAVDREASLAILTAASAHDGVLARMMELRSNHATFNDALARHHFDKANVAAGRTAAATARRLYEAQIAAEPANSKVTKDLADLLLSVSPVEWTVLKPTRMTSEGGATLTLLDDGSVLAGGRNPDTDTYNLVFEEPTPATSVIRLEALNDDSLARRGPGRYTDGLFVLARFEVREGLDSSSSTLQAPPFSEAKADVSEPDTSLELQSGRWHLGWGQKGKPHVAYYRLNKSVSGPLTLRLIFENNPEFPKLALGRFRISVSDDSRAYATENARLGALKVANPWSRLAAAYGALGESDKAVETIVRAYERTSSDTARAVVAQQAAEFEDFFSTLLDKFPNDGALRLGRAKYLAAKHIAENRFQQAVDVLSGAQSDFPDDIELLNQRASALMKLANWKAAETDYSRVIALEKEDEKRRAAERLRAEVLARMGQFQAAADVRLQELLYQPGEWNGMRYACASALLARRPEVARMASVRLFKRLQPNKDLDAFWSGGLVRLHTVLPGLVTNENQPRLLEAAGKAAPHLRAAFAAAIHYRLGDLEQAKPLLDVSQNAMEFQALAALLLYDQGDSTRAREFLKRTDQWFAQESKKDPHSAIPAQIAWDNWSINRAVWREAARKLIGPRIVELDSSLSKKSDQTSKLLERARLLVNAGLHDEALDDLERLVALNSDSPEAHTLHGQVLVELRRDAEALPILQRAIEGGTQDAAVFAARGTILLKQEKREEARADLEKSFELQPTELAARSLADLLMTEAAKATTWTVLKPAEMKSGGGATLTLQEDGSVLASGLNPLGDAYRITAPVPKAGMLRAIRLEALTHDSLPANGPGRDERRDRGNFAMNGFDVRSVSPGGTDQPVPLSQVAATYFIRQLRINHWNVGGRGGQPHTAFYKAENLTDLEQDSWLEFRMRFSANTEWPLQNLGCFRLSVSDDPDAFTRENTRLAALKSDNPWLRLALARLIHGDRTGAAANFALAFQRAVDDNQRSEVFEQASKHNDIFPEFTSRLADDPRLHVFHGTQFASKGQWKEADAAYRRAVELDANAVGNWIQTGYWKVENYPSGLAKAQPPETNPNPFLAVAHPDQKGNAAAVEWQQVTPATDGRFNFGNTVACHYVLTRLWSPRAQEVALQMGDDDSLRLFVNGGLAFESKSSGGGATRIEYEIAAMLQPGWNSVLVKLENSNSTGVLILKLSNAEQDLIAARLGSRLYEGVRLVRAENQDEGIRLLMQSIDEQSTDATLFARRAQVFQSLELWQHAADDWERADRIDPLGRIDSLYLEHQAVAFSAMKQRENELSVWTKLLRRDEEGVYSGVANWFHRARANTYRSMRQWDKARADYDRSIALTPPNLLADFLLDRGRFFAMQGKWREAADDFTAAAAHKSATDYIKRNWEFSKEYALVQLMVGDLDGYRKTAAEMERRLGEVRANWQAPWLLRIQIAGPGGVTDGNLDRLRKANTLSDDWHRPRMDAALLFRLGRYEDAAKLFEQNSGGVEYELMAAMAHQKLGNRARARQLFDAANKWLFEQAGNGPLEVAPDSQESWWWIPLLALRQETIQQITGQRLPELEKLLEADPANAAALAERALLHASIGDHKRSLTDLDRAIADNASSPELFGARGRVLAKLDRTDDALADLNKAVERNSQDAQVYTERGTILAKRGDVESAAGDLTRSLALEPSEAAARTLAALLLPQAEKSVKWTVLRPTLAKSEGKATLTLVEDGSILASGEHPDRDVYVLEVPVNIKGITVIALELLPHESLPHGGIGRGVNGQAMISEFEVASLDYSGNPQSVPLIAATADFEQKDPWGEWKATYVIDGKHDTRAWGVAPRLKERHLLIVKPATPITADPKALRIVIRQDHFNDDHPKGLLLGRFRLSVSDNPDAFMREEIRLSALKLDNPWLRLAHARLINNDLQNAVISFALAFQRAGDDTQRSAIFEQVSEHGDIFPEFTSRLADDPQFHLFIGKRLAAQGKWAESDAAFRKAVTLAAAVLPKWIQTGFWKVDGYPFGLNTAQPPESNPEPFAPVGRPGKDGKLANVSWQAVTVGGNGRFSFGTERACHYMLTRLWSPAEQEIAVQMGDDDNLRLFVNDELLFESVSNGGAASPKEYEIAAQLRSGWNTVLVKLQNDSGACNLIVNFSNDPADLVTARWGSRLFEAVQLANAGRKDDALAALKGLIGENSQEVTMHARRAEAYNQLKEWKLAEADYLRTTELNPKSETRWMALGDFHRSRQQLDSAIAAFTKSLEIKVNNGFVLHRRAFCYADLGRWQEAMVDINLAVEHRNDAWKQDFQLKRADLWRRQGKWQEAARDMREVAAATGVDSARTWTFARDLAVVQLAAGDLKAWQLAVAETDKRIGANPNGDQAGWLVFATVAGPATISADQYDRLLKIVDDKLTDKNVAWKPRLHAALLYRTEKFQEAAELFDRITDGPVPAAFQLLAAMTHHKLGHDDQAKKLFDQTNTWIAGQEGKDAGPAIPKAHGWLEWAIYKSLQREAETLLKEVDKQ